MGLGLKAILLSCILSLAAAGSQQANCRNRWTYHGGRCYRLFPNARTWHWANWQCRNVGSRLVTVHSEAENTFVYNLWRSGTARAHLGVGFWMGLNDFKEEGNYVFNGGNTADSDLSYTHWDVGQPDNYGENENCVHFWYRGEGSDDRKAWNDLACYHKLPFVCEESPN